MTTITITNRRLEATEMFDIASQSNREYILNAETPEQLDATMFLEPINLEYLKFLPEWKLASLLVQTIEHLTSLATVQKDEQEFEHPDVVSYKMKELQITLYNLEITKKAILNTFKTI